MSKHKAKSNKKPPLSQSSSTEKNNQKKNNTSNSTSKQVEDKNEKDEQKLSDDKSKSDEIKFKWKVAFFPVLLSSMAAFLISKCQNNLSDNQFISQNIGRPIITNIGYERLQVPKHWPGDVVLDKALQDSFINYYGYIPHVYLPKYTSDGSTPYLISRLGIWKKDAAHWTDPMTNIFTVSHLKNAYSLIPIKGDTLTQSEIIKIFKIIIRYKNSGNIPLTVDSVAFAIQRGIDTTFHSLKTDTTPEYLTGASDGIESFNYIEPLVSYYNTSLKFYITMYYTIDYENKKDSITYLSKGNDFLEFSPVNPSEGE